MGPIVYKSGNVVLRHFGKLFLKDTFETCEDDKTLAPIVVIDNSKFNFAITLLNDCRLGTSIISQSCVYFLV